MLSASIFFPLNVNAESAVFEVRGSVTRSAMPRAVPLPPEELAVAMERGVALFERLSLCPAPDEVQSFDMMQCTRTRMKTLKRKPNIKFSNECTLAFAGACGVRGKGARAHNAS